MPTITCKLKDLNQLAGTDLTINDLETDILLVKGELKGYNSETDELKVELQDTNRPDLWTVEGIARQLRFKLVDAQTKYDFFTPGEAPVIGTMTVDPALDYRPFAGAIAVRGVNVTDDFLVGMIQTQEKLADNLGRHRKSLSIGIYDLNQMSFPVHYKAVDRQGVTFVPLDFDTEMTPDEILKKHPKGQAYASILEGRNPVPMLMDDNDEIMSFPPVINSRKAGEVTVGQRDLFIEATGTDFMHLVLALNIFAADMADRGGEVCSIRMQYGIDTPFGRDVVMPIAFEQQNTISIDMVQNWLGADYELSEMVDLLTKYGYTIVGSESVTGEVTAMMPPWRQDLLHPVDIIEDLAICAGYDSFDAEMPGYFTVGKVAPNVVFEDRIRGIILPFGYEEVISNILCSREEFTEMIRDPQRKLVEIANPMNIKFAALRDSLLPSLLRVERDSSQATYPHRIFETGEVTVHDPTTDTGCKTRMRLGVLLAEREAEFANAHSCLESLLYSLGLGSTLKSEDIPIFIPGRSGRVYVEGQALGWIGEIHPEVLENYEITMPCAAFEIDLDELRKLVN